MELKFNATAKDQQLTFIPLQLCNTNHAYVIFGKYLDVSFSHFPICKDTFPAKTSDLHLIPISLVIASFFLLVLKMQLSNASYLTL